MPRLRRMLLSILAVLGLVSTLGWNATTMACPLDSAAPAVAMHGDGCSHAPTPAKSRLPAAPGQLCAVCIAVLSRPMQIASSTPVPSAPVAARLRSLSGFDPALDPPPPRAA